MKLVLSKTYVHTSAMVAHIIEGQLKSKPDSLIALPSGPTPEGMYVQLVDAYKKAEIDFSHAHFMGVDEYLGLGLNHPQSVAKSMYDRFFTPCNIRPDQIHLYDGANDPQNETNSWNAFLDQIGGIDLVVSGIGLNGHLAYNEPAESLFPRVHVNVLSETTRLSIVKDFSDNSEVPSQIITLGMGDLLNARKIVIMATGNQKSSVVRRIVNAKTVSTFFPASFLILHPHAILSADEDAGKEISDKYKIGDNG